MTTALAIKGASVSFGGVRALNDVSIAVAQGEIRGIIGPNGSGKSTLVNVASRLQPVGTGSVELFGSDVTRLPAREIARLGLARTFQHARLVRRLSVIENIMLGCTPQLRDSVLAIAVRTPAVRRAETEARERAREVMRFTEIEALADKRGDELSGGQMRLVEIARVLAMRPRIVLLDEPAAGLSLNRIDLIASLIRRINHELGVTVVLIEHVLNLVMSLSTRITVLVSGQVLREGSPDEVKADPEVRSVYLGRRQTP